MRLRARSHEETPGVALRPGQQAALDALRTDGIAVTTFAALVGDDALWDELRADIDAFVQTVPARLPDLDKPSSKDQFLIRRYRPAKSESAADLEPYVFAPTSPWLRLPLLGGLLDVANAYRGRPTRLVDLDHWYTVPYPTADTRVSSQRWHRDPEDQHVVKAFVYFSDVDENAGPFQYVTGSAKGSRYGDLWSWGDHDFYPPQDEFDAKIPEADRRMFTGPAGTVLLCDTSGFHRGGFARLTPRVLSYFTFVSSDSTEKRRFKVDGSPRRAGYPPAAIHALK